MRYLLAIVLLLPASSNLTAQTSTVYKCTSGNQVTYQDAPCANTQRQQSLRLDVDAPASPKSAAAVVELRPVAPVVAGNADVPPPQAGVPLPPMYRCIRAVDGQVYLSSNGRPAPFLAPFGMLGAVQMPLAQVYGQPGGAGISAPEANRGRVSRGLIANHYVWAQDQCRPLSLPEVCHALSQAYEENSHKLQHAFKSDRPPLQARDTELRAQLTHC